MPIQPRGAADAVGRILLHSEYQAGLVDLEGFSHIYLIYQFHLSRDYDLLVKPFLDTEKHGVFATRAPRRPNPIGLSIVKILSIRDNVIEFSGADMLNETPLLDIQPYMEPFDRIEGSRSGWLDATDETLEQARSDSRFIEDR
jgi:tRNA (adenine37-N6)-methyltransferase